MARSWGQAVWGWGCSTGQGRVRGDAAAWEKLVGVPPPGRAPPSRPRSLRTWPWVAEMGGGWVMLNQSSFGVGWGGPPATRRSFCKPFARQSVVLVVTPAELVGEEADGLLGELGEVDDARDEQGGEQQW